MTKNKIITIVYFALLLIGGIILFIKGVNMQSLIKSCDNTHIIDMQYAKMQTNMGVYSIVIFIVLLLISFILYYFTDNRNYVLLSNILYVGVILYVYVSLNKEYLLANNIDYSSSEEYWITVFMGVFYIIGAVLVSAIGYITIRNYTKRTHTTVGDSVLKKF
jgi:hypothetical protein